MNISPEIILILKNMLIYALLLIVASRIYVRVPGLGGGGLSQSWQCQDFDSTYYVHPSLKEHPLGPYHGVTWAQTFWIDPSLRIFWAL